MLCTDMVINGHILANYDIIYCSKEAIMGKIKIKIYISIALIAVLMLSVSCSKSPTTPPPPKPKADVRIAISIDPFLFAYNITYRYYWSIFNVILSEHNSVSVTITTLKLEFRAGTTLVATVTLSGGSLPANGTLKILAMPIVYYWFDTMKIVVTGTDANGYSINVSKTYTRITTAMGQLKAVNIY